MSVTRAASQASGAAGDNTTTVSKAFPGNVTSGDLIVISGGKYSNGADAYLAADCTKTAGTATIGTITLDGTGARVGNTLYTGIWSVPVTGTGSCTMAAGGSPAGSYLLIATQEYAGIDITSGRVAGTNSGNGSTGAPATGTVASGGGGVFVGALATDTSTSTTHTKGADFTDIYEMEDGANHVTGSFEDRIVTVDTTDAADWVAPTTRPWAACVVCYKEDAGAAQSAVPVMMRQYRSRWGQ